MNVRTAHPDSSCKDGMPETFGGDSITRKGRDETGLERAENNVSTNKHKKITWWQAVFVLIAETISLGVLSLPAALSALGMVLGAIMIVAFSVITTSTGFLLYRFQMHHPNVKGFADAAHLIAGKHGRWIVEVLNMILLIFVAAAHILTFGTEGNAIAGNTMWKCTVVFKVIALAICLLCTMPRTLRSQSWLSAISCISITSAIFIAMGDIGATNRGEGTARILPPSEITDFADWSLAISNIVVSFTGHLAYFNVMQEMERPQDFPKALIATNSIMLSLYLTVGLVIYWYGGQSVQSPALGSADPLFQKIAYGIATPTIIVAGVIAAFLASKRCHYWYWGIIKKQPEVVHEENWKARGSWIIIVVVLWILAFILANVLPFFSPLLALIGALSGTWICIGLPSLYYLYEIRESVRLAHRGINSWPLGFETPEKFDCELKQESWWNIFSYPRSADRKTAAIWFLCLLFVALTIFLVGIGMYGSIATIIRSGEEAYSPFSCA